MKKKWAQSDIIAKCLGLTKYQVFYKLYEDLVQRNMLEDALNGMNIEEIKNLDSYKKINEPNNNDEEPLTNAKKLKIAIWYLTKIGDSKEALRVLKIAIKATQ